MPLTDADKIAQAANEWLFEEGAIGYDRARFIAYVRWLLTGEGERPLNYSERVQAGLEG